jgi:hypothetical protein
LQGGSGTGGTASSDSRSLSLHSMNTPAHQPNSLSDLAGGWSTTTTAQPTNATATAMPAYSSDSSWKVSASMVPPAASNNNNDDDDNGFAMGGSAGAGLEPLAAAPAAPPPPPPPPPGETTGFW